MYATKSDFLAFMQKMSFSRVVAHMMTMKLEAIQVSQACDFQQCCILTSEDSDEPLQPPFKVGHSK